MDEPSSDSAVGKLGDAVSARPERHEVLAFGEFELEPESGQLRRFGEPVHLQQQPARVLELLVRHAGRTVSREEIREEVWGAETYVDSEQGINYCVRQVRLALDDSAGDPRFVVTVPRRGYRFIAPVERRQAAAEPPAPAPFPPAPSEPAAALSTPSPSSPERPARRTPRQVLPVALSALVVVAVAVGLIAVVLGREQAPGSGSGQGLDRNPGSAAVRPVIVPEEAHFRYLEARHLLDRIDSGEPVAAATRAIELLRAALEEAPEYAPARAALAGAWLYRLDLRRSEAFAHAEEEARAALALDPTLAEAHTVTATARLFLHFDWRGASEHLDRALELDPDDVDANFLRAVLLSARGHHEEAIAAARHAIELDPGHLPDVSLGWFYFFAHRFDEAMREAERVIAIAPLDGPSHRVLLLAALEGGDEARADREMGRYVSKLFLSRLDREARNNLSEADKAEIRAEVPGAREMFRTSWEHFDEQRDLLDDGMNPTIVAEAAIFSGDPGPAIHYLLWGCRQQAASWDLPFVAVDPRWDPLRADPRFQEVLECVGVADQGPEIPALPLPLD